MPAPRPSESAEAARAAALQAEFNEKKWVWVPDDKEGYLAGWVIHEDGEEGEVFMASGSETRRIPLYALSKMNPPKFDRVDDIADLTFLNEASVVHNLRLRYGSGAIYTYSGLFLVAINPYQNLPLYTDAIVQQYRTKRRDENPPHIFAIAERAWVSMGEERENQSILITGESGAGKTENTKKVIQYLAAIATDVHTAHSRSPSIMSPSSSFNSGIPRSNSTHRRSLYGSTSSTNTAMPLTSKGRLGLLERQILQANPILEAFGNAQTQRNNNSSRFGKFVRISFAPDGSIAGANVDWYLLEKSRVVVRSEAERSFHVFYQLLEGAGAEMKERLLLDGNTEDYEYLNKSRREVDGVDDKDEWRHLMSALDTVGFTQAEQYDLFRIVAAILHIGNITITSTRSDDALMPDPSQAERVCHLLGIPLSEFTKAVLRPRVLAGREWVTQARTRQQALDELSSLCKTLYEKSFGALVDRVNRALDRPSSKSTFIGVLDIAGFEIFETNAYEQLLINYTNEKLQQFFNHHMFVLEQEEYARESIEWKFQNFGEDLQPTIDLIESSGPSIGILSLLDEECIMPKATDTTFTRKLHQLWSGDVSFGEDAHPGRSKYSLARLGSEEGFIVTHYAGRVEYRTVDWLQKNKDPLNDNLTRVLAASDEAYVAGLFADFVEPPEGSVSAYSSGTSGKRRAVKKGAFRTVGQRHKEQLSSLMNQLQATQPHFVRCIVPNTNKKPGRVDVPLVLDQLRCNGVLEGIRIARLGYPNRLPFVEFRQRYEVLTPGIIPRGYMDGRKACLRMVDALELDRTIYRIGTSKIFFKAGVLAELEERRDALLFDVFSRLQAAARMWTARRQMKKVLNRAVAIRTIQKNARVYAELRNWPWWQLYTKVRPLLTGTRNDEELRRKEAELALARERAEHDRREKEALEGLKMRLEAEKRKVVEDLEAERALALDKDSLLERSKKREFDLEENIAALQADLDTLDSQLDRAMANNKTVAEENRTLRQAFDEAAEHLLRLESKQGGWAQREEELIEELKRAEIDINTLANLRETLQRSSEDTKGALKEREEDLARMKERMEATISDLEAKLTTELRNRDNTKSRTDTLEQELRQAQQQLTELGRTATDYSNIIKRKETDLAQFTSDLEALRNEKDLTLKQNLQLQGATDTLAAEIDALNEDIQRDKRVRSKLQEELDELRALLAKKTSEETIRTEVDRSKDHELAQLRTNVSVVQQDLNDARKAATEGQSRLKVELETVQRECTSLERSHQELTILNKSHEAKIRDIEATLTEAQRHKRSVESELQSLKIRQLDTEGKLAEAVRAKEASERQLEASQKQIRDYEDAVIQLEREKGNWTRQTEQTRKQLDDERTKREQLQKYAATSKSETARLKDLSIKQERELNKALDGLKAREWEIKQLESRQDKTIVEHVHVLEEAKRVTDRQLREARDELKEQAGYIRSLEKMKLRLTGEAEDLTREAEREVLARKEVSRVHEDRANRAEAQVVEERHARGDAEVQARRYQTQLKTANDQLAEVHRQLVTVQKSKDHLEAELVTLADQTETPNSLARIRREYETKISRLQNELDDSESSRAANERIKDRVDRQHAEIRRLILSGDPKDDSFRDQLLRELQLAEADIEREMTSRVKKLGSSRDAQLRSYVNVTPSKSNNRPANGVLRLAKEQPPLPRTPDRQIDTLKPQIQAMELRMAASERVRQHLESALRDMTSELDRVDGSKQSLQAYRARFAKENKRLGELLDDEGKARRSADAARFDGIESMFAKFQDTMAEERESYARLDESRKALVVQQRTAQSELEDQKRHNLELTRSRKQLQTELANLQDRFEREKLAKDEAMTAKRNMQTDLKEQTTVSSAEHSQLQEAVKAYRSKAEDYKRRLDLVEHDRTKATTAEDIARKALTAAETLNAKIIADHKVLQQRLNLTEKKLLDLQVEIEQGGKDSADMDAVRKKLEEELQAEHDQHESDLAERDFAVEQTQKAYQTQLAQLSEELQSQRDAMSRLREENHKIRSDYDDLQLQYDDETYNRGAWKKEKERLETKITDLNNAYDSSAAARAEQQSQIVALHSQVRELRGVLEDAEQERAMLQKARRALQTQLESIKMDNIDPDKMSAESKLQDLQLKKQDLERNLEESQDRVGMAEERMRKAELHAQECNVELGKIRVENSALDQQNANLEKRVKELNVKVVDFETKSFATPTRAAMRGRDPKLQPMDSGRQRIRSEEEINAYESKIANLRDSLADLQSTEAKLQLEKRRAEREAAEHKQKALSLEHEVDRLRSRLGRPASTLVGSPASSPRKFES